MNLQILSAGLGVRLRPITDKIPKPALPILNVPMIFYSYQYFKQAKLNKTVVNTYHLQEKFVETLKGYRAPFKFISDGNEVLGTGGGIANAQKYLEGEGCFWVINGDSLFLTEDEFVEKTQELHKTQKAIATLVVMEHEEVGRQFGGIWVDNDDQVLDMGKQRPDKAKKGYHFTGFRILSDEIFNYLKAGPSDLFDGLRAAMKDGHRVQILKVRGEFFETGNQNDFLAATRTLLQYISSKKYDLFFKDFFQKYSPESSLNDFSLNLKMNSYDKLESLFVDKNFKLFDTAELEGFVVAGKNVEIREKCFIKNCVVLDNTVIPENSIFENAIIL